MTKRLWLAALALAALAVSLWPASSALAQAKTFKIGLVLPMTGPFASTGRQIETGVRLYLAQHGDKIGSTQIELIVKDDTGVPDITKRLAQELVVNERVNVLAGFGLTPLARFVSFASRGVPPHIMGIGPIEAIPAALRAAGLKQDDIDWFELNEAFAAQSLAVINSLGLDPAKVNPMGGAIALGHPLGATGAIRSATVVHALRRHNKKYGMVTMCVGMGQGAAGIFERV